MSKSTAFISVSLVAFFLLALLAANYSYFPFDLTFTRFVQNIDAGWFRNLMIFLSWLGEPPVFIPLVIILLLVLGLRKRKDEIFLLVSFLGASVLIEAFKLLVHRVRPDPALVHQFLPEFYPDSFPSGHVMWYFSVFSFLIFLCGRYIKDRFWNRFLVWGMVGLIILIGLSRIYLGEHWLSDVLGSYLLGSAWLAIVVKVYKRVA